MRKFLLTLSSVLIGSSAFTQAEVKAPPRVQKRINTIDTNKFNSSQQETSIHDLLSNPINVKERYAFKFRVKSCEVVQEQDYRFEVHLDVKTDKEFQSVGTYESPSKMDHDFGAVVETDAASALPRLSSYGKAKGWKRIDSKTFSSPDGIFRIRSGDPKPFMSCSAFPKSTVSSPARDCVLKQHEELLAFFKENPTLKDFLYKDVEMDTIIVDVADLTKIEGPIDEEARPPLGCSLIQGCINFSVYTHVDPTGCVLTTKEMLKEIVSDWQARYKKGENVGRGIIRAQADLWTELNKPRLVEEGDPKKH